MKKYITHYLSLATIAGLALALPLHAFAADDNNPNDKKLEKQGNHKQGGKGAAQTTNPAVQTQAVTTGQHKGGFQKQAVSQQPVATAPVQQQQQPAFSKHAGRNQSVQGANTNPTANVQNVQQNSRRGNVQIQAAQQQQFVRSQGVATQSNVQFTRANSYGGRWTQGDNHSDWSRSSEHSWNHHQYRWYDGGWLIVDGGFWPVRSYQSGGRLVAQVQGALADQGYYNGEVDGMSGPGTRNAIAHYQSDSNLRITGRINDPLLQSLGLE